MIKKMDFICAALVVSLFVVSDGRQLSADEGMWLFSPAPAVQDASGAISVKSDGGFNRSRAASVLKSKYGFEPSAAWLEHLQRSSLRFNNGGSGSFVSANGLIMTNHHVGIDSVQKLSTAERDLVENGYLARSYEEELKCHDLELNVLISMEDVTERIARMVADSARPGELLSPEKTVLARRAATNTVKMESLEKTGLRSDVVSLYGGAVYHLYRYKKYTDIRLVFAPEGAIAFFGGDVDNFEYPRWDLDVTFFRAYENNKPVELQHYLSWSRTGVSDKELIFVSGHPGRTERGLTVSHLEYLRDNEMPDRLDRYRRLEVLYNTYSDRTPENARRALRALRGVENGRKCYLGVLAGAQTPDIIAKKRQAEQQLIATVRNNPELSRECGDAWQQVASALAQRKAIGDSLAMYEYGQAFNSTLYGKARALVRLADELQKPSAERLPEYGDAGLDSLKESLFSTAPIYKDFEQVKLADSLSYLLETYSPNGNQPENQLVREIMAGKSPAVRAAELVQGTKLDDPEYRRQLFDGEKQAISQSTDPMIQLARLIDPMARTRRKQYDEQVAEPLRDAYAKITKARFAAGGHDNYPDATFTLRLAFGQVLGFEENGLFVPPWTQMGGAYVHAVEHGNVPPFRLPESWITHKQDIDLNTPMNFISTPDIIGGNSGSPVVNRAGQVVGLIFDGNIHSLSWKHVFDDQIGRSVSVDSRAIIESLQKIYGAQFLVDELMAK